MKCGRLIFDLKPLQMMKFLFTVNFPDFSRKIGLKLNSQEVSDFFLSTFLQTFEYREKNNVRRNDFVSLLLNLKEFYTPTELAAEGWIVFAAGFETSSTLMTFTLYELALNPEIQERLREEIVSGIEDNDGKLTYDMLIGFKYLDMVINESLRKHPPIPDNVRKCTIEYQVPGTKLVIPKGTLCFISALGIQNDPEFFPEPEKFDPERFSDENSKSIKPFTFMPFGEGARQCLGMRFGLMQAKMGIAKLITNYSFSPCAKTPKSCKYAASSPFLSPQGGMWLSVEKI
jgi:cytochrome P450 family 6